jgi:hypothetical protein
LFKDSTNSRIARRKNYKICIEPEPADFPGLEKSILSFTTVFRHQLLLRGQSHSPSSERDGAGSLEEHEYDLLGYQRRHR